MVVGFKVNLCHITDLFDASLYVKMARILYVM